MADKLEWMEQHQILLRDSYWQYAVEKQGYKVRADLVPLFEQNPEVVPLLYALRDKGHYSVACDLLARMLHPRAAVWWGYTCMLTLLEERKVRAAKGPEKSDAVKMAEEIAKGAPFQIPNVDLKDPAFSIKKLPSFSPDMIPAIPKPAMNDPKAAATSEKIKGKTDALRALIPPSVKAKFEAGKKAAEARFVKKHGFSPLAAYQKAQETMKQSPMVLYSVDYKNSPKLQAIADMNNMLKSDLDTTLTGIKAQFPEKFPPTPEAALLFAKADQKKTSEAIQSVYRWIVAPDEVNSQLALNAGKNAAGKPEGMLAFTAFWSFGDLAPEGKMIVPTPPQLAPTGLASSLLMMSLEPGGPRKTAERWQLYYDLGIEVVFAKNLWPDALLEELAPHEKIQQAAVESDTKKEPDAKNEEARPVYKRWK